MAIIAGSNSATASEVNCAVQANIHFPLKSRKLFIRPICPITTALGSALREVAALKKLGTTNDVPSPPMKEQIENTINATYGCVSLMAIEIKMPTINTAPPITPP